MNKENEEQKEQLPAKFRPVPDWFLQQLVDLVNKTNLEMTVTLDIGGLMVSGMLISGRTYFDEFAKEFSGAYKGDQEVAKVLHDMVAQHVDMYPLVSEKDGEDESRKLEPPEYIHMRNARFFHPGGVPYPGVHEGGSLWRGRMSQVDGFHLGSISVGR